MKDLIKTKLQVPWHETEFSAEVVWEPIPVGPCICDWEIDEVRVAGFASGADPFAEAWKLLKRYYACSDLACCTDDEQTETMDFLDAVEKAIRKEFEKDPGQISTWWVEAYEADAESRAVMAKIERDQNIN